MRPVEWPSSFYHLQRQPLEAVLPTLLREVPGARLAGGRAGDDARSASPPSTTISGPFATTASCRTAPTARPNAADQPVLLTLGADNPNGAAIRFLVEGAELPADAAAYERL